ncbi:TPA: hypothetical protein ACPJ07_004524 [Vibrio diabolicus]|uniref:hypothetical protein n=1 Tax=Vibrio diabolicus TaxID=50719 RepID=UPI00215FC3F8|nr:hypothetical protein [Vibrio diabolicus]MCS0342416.1 hypothetical protein [Vibrio diabolicus]
MYPKKNEHFREHISELFSVAFPFVLIGLVTSMLLMLYNQNSSVVVSVLSFFNLNVDLGKHMTKIAEEQMGIYSLMYFSCLSVFLSSIGRLLFGCNPQAWFYKRITNQLISFTVGYNSAILGITWGVFLTTLVDYICYDGEVMNVKYLIAFTIIPVLMSLMIYLAKRIPKEEGIFGFLIFGRLGQHIDGFFVTILLVLYIKFQDVVINFLNFTS